MAENLTDIPGRKILILFSAGFPLRNNTELMSELTAAIDSCNRSNVAIYPIDVRGLVAGPLRLGGAVMSPPAGPEGTPVPLLHAVSGNRAGPEPGAAHRGVSSQGRRRRHHRRRYHRRRHRGQHRWCGRRPLWFHGRHYGIFRQPEPPAGRAARPDRPADRLADRLAKAAEAEAARRPPWSRGPRAPSCRGFQRAYRPTRTCSTCWRAARAAS